VVTEERLPVLLREEEKIEKIVALRFSMTAESVLKLSDEASRGLEELIMMSFSEQ
jgi:hypothetical protein